MGRTGGKETKEKILKTAGRLFARKGIDATTVDEIAAKADVNKALIYYHFKNKDDLINSLFTGYIESLLEHMALSFETIHNSGETSLPEGIKEIISFLSSNRGTTGMILIEAVKTGKYSHLLFKLARILITNEEKGVKALKEKHHPEIKTKLKETLVDEFFNGFMPLVSFILFREKFAGYFEMEQEELTSLFIKAFEKSHLPHHGNNG